MKTQIAAGVVGTFTAAFAALLHYLLKQPLEAHTGAALPAEFAQLIMYPLLFPFVVIAAAVGKKVLAKYGITFSVLAVLLAAPALADAAPTGRISLKERTVKTGTVAEYTVDEVSLRPIVIINAVSVPLDRRSEFEAGVTLSGCYGAVWSPEWWDETDDDPFGSIGLCFETGLVVGSETGGPEGTTYLALQPGAVLTLMHYVAIGFGRRQRLSLTDDGRDTGSWVLTLGLTAATF